MFQTTEVLAPGVRRPRKNGDGNYYAMLSYCSSCKSLLHQSIFTDCLDGSMLLAAAVNGFADLYSS